MAMLKIFMATIEDWNKQPRARSYKEGRSALVVRFQQPPLPLQTFATTCLPFLSRVVQDLLFAPQHISGHLYQ